MSVYSDGGCPPRKDDYAHKVFFSVLLQSIPVIGPAIDGYVPGPKNQQGKLDELHSNLASQVTAWQKEITTLTIQNTQDINDLITTILGDPDNGAPGYADVVSQYYVEPVKEQTTINTINIAFLAIMMSLLVWYLLINKKST
jgi:hypothetical protein